MGFLKDLVGVAAPIAGSIFGGPIGGALAGMLGGAISGSGQPKSTTSTQQQKMDPRMEAMLFGADGKSGLLSQYQGMLDDPRSAAATSFAGASGDYLSQYGAGDLGAARGAALGVMGGNSAPMATAPQAQNTTMAAGTMQAPQVNLSAYASGNMVDAPKQNGVDVSGSYDSLINGQAGANPYLTGAIGKGINQSNNAFGNMLTDAKSATQDLLGGIRGGAMMAGQFGGSRQGLAEGKALDSFNTNVTRAATQFGQNNTDAAVAAQAGAYDADRNRQLAATQGLSSQQYGVAQQNAATKNAAEFMNVGNMLDVNKTNAGLQAQANTANLGALTQANQVNATQGQQNNQFNAGLAQQTNLANQGSQLTTNAQNNGAALGGAGLLSGLLGSASGTVNQNDNWSLDRASQVNGLLSPYLGMNQSSSRTDPLYSNPMGNAVGGAGLGSQIAGLFGGSGKDSQGGAMGGLADLFGGKFLNF